MKKVDFMCIGAPKSGTTWLFHHLNKHPKVFIPMHKELNYFNKHHPEHVDRKNENHNKDADWYHNAFKKAQPNQILGDFSTSYLNQENCALDIFNYNPKSKIIVILRNPVDRSFSHYQFLEQRGFISNISFEEASINYPHIISNSLYGKYLAHYYNHFSKDQIKIIDFVDIEHNPEKVLTEVQNYLGIDKMKHDDLKTVINKTKDVRIKFLNPVLNKTRGYVSNRIINKLMEMNTVENESKNGLDSRTKEKLLGLFRRDYLLIEELTGLKFEHWFE